MANNTMKNNVCMEIGHAMMDFNRKFKSFMKSELAQHDLNLAEGLTLLALFEKDGRPAEALLGAVSIDKSVMTRTLQNLEKSGMVSRDPNPVDGRSWIFHLTPSGKTNAKAAIDAIKKWSESSFEELSPEETIQLLTLLKKM